MCARQPVVVVVVGVLLRYVSLCRIVGRQRCQMPANRPAHVGECTTCITFCAYTCDIVVRTCCAYICGAPLPGGGHASTPRAGVTPPRPGRGSRLLAHTTSAARRCRSPRATGRAAPRRRSTPGTPAGHGGARPACRGRGPTTNRKSGVRAPCTPLRARAGP